MTQNATFIYTYDNAGNITAVKRYAYTTGDLGAVQSTANYTYATTGNWKDLLVNYNGHAISYDDMGNMTSYNGNTYTWQGRQLKKIQGGGNTYTYKYNADGIRTSKTVNGTTTEYFLNGSQILAQKTGSETLWFFYDSQGQRVGMVSGGVLYYYLYNQQGDVIALARASTGQIAARYAYDAWGNCTVTNATGYTIGNKNPFRYRGYYYDTETGMYYLNSRYYSPEFGRFISADVFVSTGQGVLGSNMYAYCNNNPVVFSDPSGCIIVLAGGTTEDEKLQYESALDYIRKSKAGAELIEKLEKSSGVFTITIVYDDNMYYDPSTRTIHFDPYSGLVMGDGTSVQSAALGLAHEMGHGAQHLDGELSGDIRAVEESNVLKYETPIAKQLGEPVRNNYNDCVGTQRMNNSTHYITTYHRPWWHYLAPWNWFKPRTVITEYNK